VEEDAKLDGQEEADQIFRANSSLRYKRMDALERWVSGRQYDGLPSFWSDDYPLWDRAPCIVYPVTAIAIDSFVDLVCGGDRFAEFSTKPDEDEGDETDGLDPEASATVDRFLKSWHRRSRFRSVVGETLASAMAAGSAAVVHGVRSGKPFNDLIPGKWCEPTLGSDGAVTKLEIRYAYQEHYRDPRSNKWAARTRLYRRVIDDQRDVEYLPGDANIQGIEPEWKENPARSVDHGFGFCPVVWYPFMRGNVPVSMIDGEAIHTNFTDEIRAHDTARSQWHRGGLMSEPQMYEIGVPPGYNPTETGVTPVVLSTERGGAPSPQNPVMGAFVDRGGGRGKPARKRGPGYVYQYPSDAKVDAIFYPGDSLKAQSDNCADLRLKLMEMFGVVLLDPESLRSVHQLSGKTLEALKEKQLDRCDRIRDDVSEHLLQPSISIQLRIARSVLAKKLKLSVAGAKNASSLLDKFGAGDVWSPPSVQVKWGEYLRSDPQEQLALVQMVLLAMNSAIPVITIRAAVAKLAPIFGIDNVDAFVEQVMKEATDRSTQQSLANTDEIRGALAEITKSKPNDDGTPPAEARPGQSPGRTLQAAPSGEA
jgi:hypothetical protein